MSYTIEVYRGNQKAERHFGIYALYVMFYPQLVAGPIERPQNVLHQFHEKHTFNGQQFLDGFRLMLWGLFKKVVIADRLSIYVNIIFEQPDQYHYLNLLLASLFFSIQIYCDFSGYSDIAIGAARTMGFKLMTNFNRPYFSKNIQEFWSRWHISLSTWFRDYLYISLGGNRVPVKRMYVNVAIVFIISGFWHGANWTFLIWGAIHAVFIILFMLYKQFSTFKIKENMLSNGLAIIFTFTIVTLAWVYFRAESVSSANAFLSHLFHFEKPTAFTFDVKNNDLGFIFNKFSLVIVALSLIIMGVIEKMYPPDLVNVGKNKYRDLVFSIAILTLIICFGVFKQQSFIYFQF
jgi:D-alanyl-lipoteichoic acid acyltransferase DltB (MBOAT superfamily)